MRKVRLHRLGGQVEAVRDLSVRLAVCGHSRHAQFARRQRLHSAATVPPWAAACRPELSSRVLGNRSRTATGGQIQALGQQWPSRDAMPGTAHGRSQLGHRLRTLKQRGRVPQGAYRLLEQVETRPPAVRQPGGSQRDAERAGQAQLARVRKLGISQFTCGAAVAEQQSGLGGSAASVQVRDVPNLHTPHLGAEHRQACLEVPQSRLAIPRQG